jgi:hypothetical protein
MIVSVQESGKIIWVLWGLKQLTDNFGVLISGMTYSSETHIEQNNIITIRTIKFLYFQILSRV